MKILVTGANGFIGKNLVSELQNRGYHDLLLYDVDSDPALLDQYTLECEFVFHLAGVNRPKDPVEFMNGNFGFTSVLLQKLHEAKNMSPILITSSIQAVSDNLYGESKRAGEELIREYGRAYGVNTYIYRLPNVFGKWCRPNYNSVVATFCYNIAHKLPINIHDPKSSVNLVYIDDVVDSFIRHLENKPVVHDFCKIPEEYQMTVGEIADLLMSFRESRKTLMVPDMGNPFVKKLYSTYLSYLPLDGFKYPLLMHCDNRGSFTEFIKSKDRGQVSVNISKPHITKGNHWHHTKNEKFLVVSGSGVIRFRKLDETSVIEYPVSGDNLEVIDTPVGYSHSIVNTGETDMVTLIWVNEVFDPSHPDTYYLEV